MAVRLREADSMAAMAELRQKVAELEIQVCVCMEEDEDEGEEKWPALEMCFQKEEGLIKGQLNHSDLRQYINQLKNQIAELKNEVGHALTHRTRHIV